MRPAGERALPQPSVGIIDCAAAHSGSTRSAEQAPPSPTTPVNGMNLYSALKALHVAGAVLMLGNVTVSSFWALFMYQYVRSTGGLSFKPIAKAILWADLLFTFGGSLLITATGIAMILMSSMPVLQNAWLIRGIVAMGVSAVLWLGWLLPDQLRLARTENPLEIQRYFRRWNALGWLAAIPLFYSLWIMIIK